MTSRAVPHSIRRILFFTVRGLWRLCNELHNNWLTLQEQLLVPLSATGTGRRRFSRLLLPSDEATVSREK